MGVPTSTHWRHESGDERSPKESASRQSPHSDRLSHLAGRHQVSGHKDVVLVDLDCELVRP